jgi:hypothetical protein
MHSGLWELLSDWKNIGDEEGAPEELLSKGAAHGHKLL